MALLMAMRHRNELDFELRLLSQSILEISVSTTRAYSMHNEHFCILKLIIKKEYA